MVDEFAASGPARSPANKPDRRRTPADPRALLGPSSFVPPSTDVETVAWILGDRSATTPEAIASVVRMERMTGGFQPITAPSLKREVGEIFATYDLSVAIEKAAALVREHLPSIWEPCPW